jgi:hypothetical protein
MTGNTSAASTPSYASGWDLAHARCWPGDVVRREYLRIQNAKERPPREPDTTRTPEERRRFTVAQRRRRAARLLANPPAPCVICGGPRRSWKGEKCMACNNNKRCPACGLVQRKSRRECRACGSRMRVGL